MNNWSEYVFTFCSRKELHVFHGRGEGGGSVQCGLSVHHTCILFSYGIWNVRNSSCKEWRNEFVCFITQSFYFSGKEILSRNLFHCQRVNLLIFFTLFLTVFFSIKILMIALFILHSSMFGFHKMPM